MNFLQSQALGSIHGLWVALKQCPTNAKGEVVVPGRVSVQLIGYLEQTQSIVQLYIRLPRPDADTPPSSPPSEEPATPAKRTKKTARKTK